MAKKPLRLTLAKSFLEIRYPAMPEAYLTNLKWHSSVSDTNVWQLAVLLRVSRDREHGFQRIVSNDFRGS